MAWRSGEHRRTPESITLAASEPAAEPFDSTFVRLCDRDLGRFERRTLWNPSETAAFTDQIVVGFVAISNYSRAATRPAPGITWLPNRSQFGEFGVTRGCLCKNDMSPTGIGESLWLSPRVIDVHNIRIFSDCITGLKTGIDRKKPGLNGIFAPRTHKAKRIALSRK